MDSSPNAIERRAINISGRLGSLYDTARDLLLDQHCFQGFDNPEFQEDSACQVYQGEPSNGIMNFLKSIKFEDALLQSIALGIVKPSGISSFINYNQPVDDSTQFLYYSYKYREEKLNITDSVKNRISLFSSALNKTTYMITKIIWGFEVLCVIPKQNNQSAKEIEDLLYEISGRLMDYDKTFKLTDKEERQINELSNVTIFGSETCIDNPNTPLSTVLTRIQDWKKNTRFYCPVLYTICSLKWLYKNQQIPELCYFSQQDDFYISQIEPIITHLDASLNDLKRLFKNFPKTVSSGTLNQWLNDTEIQIALLLSTYEAFRKQLGNMLINVRRGTHKSNQIDRIISDKRYLSLGRSEIDNFYAKVQQWSNRFQLIKRLNDDKIIYINILDILPQQNISLTKHNVDAALTDYFSKEDNFLILWCSSDLLKQEKPSEWDEVYQKLTLERQHMISQSTLIYVDFSGCQQNLEDFIVLRLPKELTSITSSDDLTSKTLIEK